MPNLSSMIIRWSASTLQELLRTPHQLRWTRVARYISLDPEDCDMLTTLPSLEWLSCGAMCKVDFLFSLPALRFLDLRLYGCLSTPPELASALQNLTLLTDLSLLGAELNDDELTSTLSTMPMLELLSLSDLSLVRTMAPLTCGFLPRTLKTLCLSSFPRPSVDVIPHLLQPRSLTHLEMDKMIIDFDDALVQPLRVPSVALPQLLSSSIK